MPSSIDLAANPEILVAGCFCCLCFQSNQSGSQPNFGPRSTAVDRGSFIPVAYRSRPLKSAGWFYWPDNIVVGTWTDLARISILNRSRVSNKRWSLPGINLVARLFNISFSGLIFMAVVSLLIWSVTLRWDVLDSLPIVLSTRLRRFFLYYRRSSRLW